MAKKQTVKKEAVKKPTVKKEAVLFEFEEENISNNKKIEGEYSRLETFIDEHENIESKKSFHAMVECWKDKFNLKRELFVSQQEFKTAVASVNRALGGIENAENNNHLK